jgi:hypothetical protein
MNNIYEKKAKKYKYIDTLSFIKNIFKYFL